MRLIITQIITQKFVLCLNNISISSVLLMTSLNLYK